jgi:hypothetical protein
MIVLCFPADGQWHKYAIWTPFTPSVTNPFYLDTGGKGVGATLDLWTWSGSANQKWWMNSGDVGFPIYIHNAANQLAVDCHYPCTQGSYPVLWYQNSNDTELWYVSGFSLQYQFIQSWDYGTYVDWGPGAPYKAKHPHMWNGNGTLAQRWLFSPVS